jgi:hypothetical protein
MSKINLLEAKFRLEELKVVDLFSSYLTKLESENEQRIVERKILLSKIRSAEKHFKIDDILHQINLLNLEKNYYNPSNIIFYYKDNIPDELEVKSDKIYTQILKEIEALETKLNEISEHVYIEV